jgi:glutamine synthetase adenylyltransferase
MSSQTMTQETKLERKRRQARERSARRRERNRKRREAIGETTFKMKMGAGTAADINCIRQFGEYQEAAEAVTLAIRYMAALARRDPLAFRQAMNPRNPL